MLPMHKRGDYNIMPSRSLHNIIYEIQKGHISAAMYNNNPIVQHPEKVELTNSQGHIYAFKNPLVPFLPSSPPNS